MPDLRAVLDKLPRDHVVIPIRGERETFITTGNVRPFTAASLGNRFRYWVRQSRASREFVAARAPQGLRAASRGSRMHAASNHGDPRS
jgi:hypothetical protein